jgi:hypothetical protein
MTARRFTIIVQAELLADFDADLAAIAAGLQIKHNGGGVRGIQILDEHGRMVSDPRFPDNRANEMNRSGSGLGILPPETARELWTERLHLRKLAQALARLLNPVSSLRGHQFPSVIPETVRDEYRDLGLDRRECPGCNRIHT